ncbi:hypothetical protein PRZ48_004484 [Zasmidium cellare]|uniref:Terpene cyclase/mutase family member n=1 Tax=Zasmidium cellare TaxID=395010 RepID=A0ABR0EPP4_ZASCE|nr:hypothetical protein PRZ48_004484 [Zasmidium cellare]
MTSMMDHGQPKDDIIEQCHGAIVGARRYAISSMKTEDHWDGEVRCSVTFTALYVFLYQCLELDLSQDRGALILYLESQQSNDGSWSISPENGGDMSVSVEAYLALKLLGVDPQLPKMQAAKDFILSEGGMSQVRAFTRMYLAVFGLFSWDSVPQSLPELILIPDAAPISIYRFSSWTRNSMMPLMILCYHRPIYSLPNGCSSNNGYLDELWHDPQQKLSSFTPPYSTLLRERSFFGLGARVVDAIFSCTFSSGLPGFAQLRKYAARKCMEWVLTHQEASGDWGGYMPPIHAGIMAMHVEGIPIHDLRFKRALQALERLAINDALGKRVQACTSAIWDTALMAVGLLDTCTEENEDTRETRKHVSAALGWLNQRQKIGYPGDWRVYRPLINSGGYAFEDYISWYPDVDDTRVVIIAAIKLDPASVVTDSVRAALDWVLGMQSPNGGWAAFDYDNDNSLLNFDPAGDTSVFWDPPTADVSGGVLESLGLILTTCQKYVQDDDASELMEKVAQASEAAIKFLVKIQESDGSWWGRWGCNYLYGTFCVLCALEHFHGRKGFDFLGSVIDRGIEFVYRWQNADGGWGESALSYNAEERAKQTGMIAIDSTASQTAWAVMTLLAFRPTSDKAIMRGVEFLLNTQTQEGYGGKVNGLSPGDRAGRSWTEEMLTSTGFPGHLMLGYEFYSHYWPMMALGRFVAKRQHEA